MRKREEKETEERTESGKSFRSFFFVSIATPKSLCIFVSFMNNRGKYVFKRGGRENDFECLCTKPSAVYSKKIE